MNEVKLAVIGAGVIGKRHLKAISAVAQAKLVAIVDTDPRAKEIAAAVDAPFYETTGTMFRDLEPDGVVISTPTDHHLQPLLECLQAGTHVLVEKPIAATMQEAEAVVAVSEKVSRHVLVGYHRRYYENIQETRRLIQNGTLGQLVGVCGQWTVRKADAYFETDWRQLRTAGPVMINLSHEIDTLRFVCGEIGSLSAKIRSGIRGHPKEETAAVLLNFECGALGTFLLSDTTPSPWTWEHATGENPVFPKYGQNVYRFVGSEAALDFPSLILWQHHGNTADWNHQMTAWPIDTRLDDAFEVQCAHFCRVIAGREQPRITAPDAARSLAAVLAVFDAAEQGVEVRL